MSAALISATRRMQQMIQPLSPQSWYRNAENRATSTTSGAHSKTVIARPPTAFAAPAGASRDLA